MVVYCSRILIEFLISNYYGRIKGSQVVLMVKNPSASAGDVRDRDLIPGLGRSPGERHGNLLQYSCLSDFPGGSDGKEPACNEGDLGSISGLGRSLGGGHGNPLQYSCLGNPHGQRSLAGYSPWVHKELDITEQLSTWKDYY